MTTAARIAATIEVLDKIETSASSADDAVSAYYRKRRFIGSTDRRDISERVYAIQRSRARLDWWTEGGSTRAKVLTYLSLENEMDLNQIGGLFTGGTYAPPPLTSDETTYLEKISGRKMDDPEMPAAVRLEIPEWLHPSLSNQWGDRTETELAALNQPASVDLRVNLLKGDCARAIDVLKKDGIEADPTPLSPIGLRLKGRSNLRATTAFRGGFVEPQDEASQIAALLCDT
ncbi:MAG: rRNA cytosine-C5-methylase, partial [Rhodospirillales bacterium]|nr:rRNA cytosine-C5-methylase [Rhodospirillales bacterium]